MASWGPESLSTEGGHCFMALPSWRLAGALLSVCAGTRRARRVSEALAVGRVALPVRSCVCRCAGGVMPLSEGPG